MTHPQNDIMIRSITGAGELGLFCALDYLFNDELADDLASGRRRPEWMWVALRGERLVARAAWWGSADDAAPSLLDIAALPGEPCGIRGRASGDQERGVDALVGDGLAVIEAFGVDAEQDFDAVPGPFGDPGRGYSGVEPQRDRCVPQVVRSSGQR
jgi:hypothetical protein